MVNTGTMKEAFVVLKIIVIKYGFLTNNDFSVFIRNHRHLLKQHAIDRDTIYKISKKA